MVKAMIVTTTMKLLFLYLLALSVQAEAGIRRGRQLLIQPGKPRNSDRSKQAYHTRSLYSTHRKVQRIGYDTPPFANMITRHHNNNKYPNSSSSKSCKTGGGDNGENDYDDYDADLPYYGIGGKGKGKGYCAPTVSPAPSISSEPTDEPSFSNTPSSSPSTAPSPNPTTSPSVQPTPLPSVKPTSSQAPSSQPSPYPTVSSEPSASASPTYELMVTVPIGEGEEGGNIGWESTCVEQPKDGGTFQDQQLVFVYHLFVPSDYGLVENDAIATGVSYQPLVDQVEERIHQGLVEHFMSCRTMDDDGYDWYIWNVSSMPQDVPLDNEPECVPDTNDPPAPPDSKCVRVVAQLHMMAYFVNGVTSNDDSGDTRRRRLLEPEGNQYDVTVADPQIISSTGSYLGGSMSEGKYNDDSAVLQTTFKGFILEDNVDDILGGGNQDGNNVAAATEQLQAQNDNGLLITGLSFVAVAILCFLALLIVVCRRRHRRKQIRVREYAKQVNDLEMEHDDLFAPTVECDASHIDSYFDGDSPTWSFDNFQRENASSSNYQHDVHNCSSATCEICRRYETLGPEFLSLPMSNENNKAIIADLADLEASPSMSARSNSRSYTTPDTVDI